MIQTVKPGIYKHYKGKNYEVIGTVVHSETMETMVLYKALYSSPGYPEGTLWVRPESMFMESVKINGELIPRFSRISV